jgi:hypothetical protein
MEFITEIEILEAVDEYSLFCFYLTFNPIIGNVYKSPVRLGDDIPSFGLYERKISIHKYPTEFMWKDAALSYPNFGDIFDLVVNLYGLDTRNEGLEKIASDFNIGSRTPLDLVRQLPFYTPEFKPPSIIKVKSRPFNTRDLNYWKQYNVTTDNLKEYNTTAVAITWVGDFLKFPSQCYAYRIYTRYQLYQPYVEKKKKFINNWDINCVPGWEQLKGYDTLIITKAYKDVISLSTLREELQFDVIAPRGENILLPTKCLKLIESKYKHIQTLMDNDGKTSASSYPYRLTTVPLESGTKDITDYMAKYGVNKTKELLKHLINDK